MPVTLQVGERAFTTTQATLSKSEFLTAMLSGGSEGDLLDNGSYFIDADPDIFEYVLRYLRHGIFPLFYDKAKGHDYHRYLTVLEQSRFLRIHALEKWINEKTYLKAVRTLRRISVMQDVDNIYRSSGVDVGVKYYPTWKEERVYICPRGISTHRGNQGACGRQCRNAQGDAEPEFINDLVLRTMVVEEETVLDTKICIEDGR